MIITESKAWRHIFLETNIEQVYYLVDAGRFIENFTEADRQFMHACGIVPNVVPIQSWVSPDGQSYFFVGPLKEQA